MPWYAGEPLLDVLEALPVETADHAALRFPVQWVARQDGMPFHFSKNRDGSWGWMELRGDWDLEKDRAQHAVKTVQDNAKLYQKAEAVPQ